MEQNIEKKLKKYSELIKLGERTLKKHRWNENNNKMYNGGAPSLEDYSGYLGSCISLIKDTLKKDSHSYLMIEKLINSEKTSLNSYYYATCFGIIKAAKNIYMGENKSDVQQNKLNNTIISGNDMNKKVFVIHGRDEKIREFFFIFLRCIGLDPIDWNKAIKSTGQGSPYVSEIVETSLNEANSIVVLFTPDEIATLKEEYIQSSEEDALLPQPRPNVLFEAGMAMGFKKDKTILVEVGKIRVISDLIGRHVVKFDGTSEKRLELINKLKTVGCDVNDSNPDWMKVGDFTNIIRKKIKSKKEHAKFKLMRAIYETDEYFIDVYNELYSRIKENSLSVTASNDIAGDPQERVKKRLTITYESYGKINTVEVLERESITLP